nr:hypothetical protein [Tanacetum cinerariifolium]
MMNVIPPDHVDDVPVVEPNQHDDVPVVPEPVLVDEDEDPEEEEFEEEEDDMEVDIEKDENEPELTYPYEEVDPLNPPPPAFESEPEDVTEVENTIKHEDETVPTSIHEVGESSATPFLRENNDGLLPGLMRRDINSLFGRMDSLSRRLCGCETTHALVKKKGKAKDEYYGRLILDLDKVECKKLKKELEEVRFNNTFLRMQNERVERDLYWTRVQVHKFYQEMIHRGFMFEERLNKAIDVPVKIMPPKSTPLTQAAIHRMIKESVDVAIVTERARHANARNDARGFGPVRGQDATPAVQGKKVKFSAATLQGPALSWWNAKNNQKQGNTRAMVTAPTIGKVSSGSLPLCTLCFTRHDGPCTIKCYKYGKVGHKARYWKKKSVATDANAQPIPTCYNHGEQGHNRNRCPKKVKHEEAREVRGSDRSFVDTRFSSMLNIDLVKIRASYEVELADGRVVSMNTVLKGCILNLVNHIFEINLMPIQLGTFGVIIGMD